MALYDVYTKLKTIAEEGGEAYIYKVRHNDLGYVRALRVLKASIYSEQDKKFRNFKKECKNLLRLGNGNHPNIVHIYQPRFWKDPNNDEGGRAFVEMDYVDGMDLLKYLRQQNGFVPAEDVLRMVEQISSALAFCHVEIYKYSMTKKEEEKQEKAKRAEDVIKKLIKKYRVVHNDIHSNNIMRRENGDYILLDFGLSFAGEELVRTSRRKAGVLEFMAPEKWDENVNDKVLTPQLDIYGFGVVMYEYLTGKVPFKFEGTSKTEQLNLMNQIKASNDSSEVVPSIYEGRKSSFETKYKNQTYNKDYPDWLEDVIYKCLQKDPEKRYPDGKALYEDVMEHLKKENPTEKLKKELERQVNDLNKSIDDLSATLDQSNKDKEQLPKEKNGLQQELDKANKAISGLKKKIEELKKKPPISSVPETTELVERIAELEEQTSISRKKLKASRKKLKAFKIGATAVCAVLLACFGLFGWVANDRIKDLKQSSEQDKTEISNLKITIGLKHPELDGVYIGGAINKKNDTQIILMRQEQEMDEGYVVATYSLKGYKYELVDGFRVDGGLRSQLRIPRGYIPGFDDTDTSLIVRNTKESDAEKYQFDGEAFVLKK